MITVLIADSFTEQIQPAVLERASNAVLEKHVLETENDLTVAIEGDERLRELNQAYLDIDAPTDVLSFPSGGDEIDPDTGHPYLGDIMVSYPRALEQAQLAGHAVLDEVQLLVIHGTLHLLGYDHAAPEEKEEMWQIQGEILQELGIHLKRLPE